MPKAKTKTTDPGARKPGARRARGKGKRDSLTGQPRAGEGQFETVMKAAERSGLLGERNGRIAGRVSPVLVKQAKRRTGIRGDTDLIAFALASVALEDGFPEAFKDARGKVDAGVKLGF